MRVAFLHYIYLYTVFFFEVGRKKSNYLRLEVQLIKIVIFKFNNVKARKIMKTFVHPKPSLDCVKCFFYLFNRQQVISRRIIRVVGVVIAL